MAIVIIRQDGKTESWKKALKARSGQIEIYSHEEEHPRDRVRMAIVWKHPHGSLGHYPNLEYIASFGAGVDFIFEDPGLPANIPVTRVVDPVLASDMSEFVLAQILSQLKHLKTYAMDQYNHRWKPREYSRISGQVVGILGLGALGSVLAKDLEKLGFKLCGWAASGKKELTFPVYVGEGELGAFLKNTTILVCLLPLTDKTRGILNKELFSRLPKGAFIINVARGGHLVDEDLLLMLNNGHLSGAALDVFHEEPLANDHPFWDHPGIHLTPHIASVSDQDSVIPQLLENYERLIQGRPFLNQVSLGKRY